MDFLRTLVLTLEYTIMMHFTLNRSNYNLEIQIMGNTIFRRFMREMHVQNGRKTRNVHGELLTINSLSNNDFYPI